MLKVPWTEATVIRRAAASRRIRSRSWKISRRAWRQTGAVEAHLHTVQPAGDQCVESPFEAWPAKGSQEHADLDRGLALGRRGLSEQGMTAACRCQCEGTGAMQKLAPALSEVMLKDGLAHMVCLLGTKG